MNKLIILIFAIVLCGCNTKRTHFITIPSHLMACKQATDFKLSEQAIEQHDRGDKTAFLFELMEYTREIKSQNAQCYESIQDIKAYQQKLIEQ